MLANKIFCCLRDLNSKNYLKETNFLSHTQKILFTTNIKLCLEYLFFVINKVIESSIVF